MCWSSVAWKFGGWCYGSFGCWVLLVWTLAVLVVCEGVRPVGFLPAVGELSVLFGADSALCWEAVVRCFSSTVEELAVDYWRRWSFWADQWNFGGGDLGSDRSCLGHPEVV